MVRAIAGGLIDLKRYDPLSGRWALYVNLMIDEQSRLDEERSLRLFWERQRILAERVEDPNANREILQREVAFFRELQHSVTMIPPATNQTVLAEMRQTWENTFGGPMDSPEMKARIERTEAALRAARRKNSHVR
jgi:cobalamin biosynthesis protein CobT